MGTHEAQPNPPRVETDRPNADGPFTPLQAYYMVHDYDREMTFRWDGQAEFIEVIPGNPLLGVAEIYQIPIQGTPWTVDPIGHLQWFQSICESHIRMKEAVDAPAG